MLLKIRRISYAAFAAVLATGCGDVFTSTPADSELLDAPIEGLTSTELAAFLRGDVEFGRRFSVVTGLGPIFNNVSCAACHSGDGRGRPDNALSRIGSAADDFLRPLGGPQIQTQAVPGVVPEFVPSGVAVSLRLPPPVFGVGLLEAVPVATVLALADPNDANGDGISGRPNWVNPAPYVSSTELGGGAGPQLGRFGRKAAVSSLLEQTVSAYHQDMGITSLQLPDENENPLSPVGRISDAAADPEVSHNTVQSVVHYLRTLAAPTPGPETADRVLGRQLFQQAKCAACHTPQLTTGASTVAALSNKTIAAYSDMLLHDMGPGLADNRPDAAATGSEWRTPPLWGLRLMRKFLNGDAFLLHDGRARSVDEAIRLHGGEAAMSRDAYVALTPAQRAALLAFVESR